MDKFAKFIIDKGLVTTTQIVAALDRQRKLSRPIGRIALSERMLSMEQVFTILSRQSETEKKFGETAQELGWLTQEQIQQLLEIQLDEHRIGDILVEMDAIDKKTLDIVLQCFKSGVEQVPEDYTSRRR